jgi:hypothetical protein
VVDRCVPDAVAFSGPGEYAQKASDLLAALDPESANIDVHPGHTILLIGDPEEIRVRAAIKNKERTVEYTRRLQELHERVYPRGEDITYVYVQDLTAAEVVKEVARIIYLEPYVACSIKQLLARIREGEVRIGDDA